eukprot:3894253-Rhodomonas_salina.2
MALVAKKCSIAVILLCTSATSRGAAALTVAEPAGTRERRKRTSHPVAVADTVTWGNRLSGACEANTAGLQPSITMVSGCVDTAPHKGIQGGFLRSAALKVCFCRPNSLRQASRAFFRRALSGSAASSEHGRGGVEGEWKKAPHLPFFFPNGPATCTHMGRNVPAMAKCCSPREKEGQKSKVRM